MPPDPPRNTSHLRRSARALVYQASHYRGAYWLIAHWPPPQKNSTQHATGQVVQGQPGPCQPVSGWGVYSKIWAPFHSRTPQKIFRKMLATGGDRRYFFENKSFENNFFPEISKIFSEEILHF